MLVFVFFFTSFCRLHVSPLWASSSWWWVCPSSSPTGWAGSREAEVGTNRTDWTRSRKAWQPKPPVIKFSWICWVLVQNQTRRFGCTRRKIMWTNKKKVKESPKVTGDRKVLLVKRRTTMRKPKWGQVFWVDPPLAPPVCGCKGVNSGKDECESHDSSGNTHFRVKMCRVSRGGAVSAPSPPSLLPLKFQIIHGRSKNVTIRSSMFVVFFFIHYYFIAHQRH